MVVRGGVEPTEAQRRDCDLQPLAQRDVAVAQQAERPGADRGDATLLVVDGQAQGQPLEGRGSADLGDEREVGGAAAEGDVLAVVGRWRWVALALGQRLHGAAERWPGLE